MGLTPNYRKGLIPNYREVIVSDRFQTLLHEGFPGLSWEVFGYLLGASPVLGRFVDDHPEEKCYAQLPEGDGWFTFRRGRTGQVVLLAPNQTRPNGTFLNLAPLWA